MDFNTIATELDGRNDPTAFDYDSLIAGLQTIEGQHSNDWTNEDICTSVPLSFSDFSPQGLTTNQLLIIACIIQSMWRTYAVTLEGKTRKEVLLLC